MNRLKKLQYIQKTNNEIQYLIEVKNWIMVKLSLDPANCSRFSPFIIWVEEMITMLDIDTSFIPKKTNEENLVSRYFALGLNKTIERFYDFDINQQKRLKYKIDTFLSMKQDKDIDDIGKYPILPDIEVINHLTH